MRVDYVVDTSAKAVKDFLDKNVNLQKSTEVVYKFVNSFVEVCFYMDSDQLFDFDPKEINSLDQWNQFLDLFREMSKEFRTDILFKPEDSLSNDDLVLVKISIDRLEYNFNVIKEFRN